jgi:hypothetical protein
MRGSDSACSKKGNQIGLPHAKKMARTVATPPGLVRVPVKDTLDMKIIQHLDPAGQAISMYVCALPATRCYENGLASPEFSHDLRRSGQDGGLLPPYVAVSGSDEDPVGCSYRAPYGPVRLSAVLPPQYRDFSTLMHQTNSWQSHPTDPGGPTSASAQRQTEVGPLIA